MVRIAPIALLGLLAACAQTACEAEQDLRLECAEAEGAIDTTDGAVTADLPECSNGSVAECQAECLLGDADPCAVSRGSASSEEIRAWSDCRVACEPLASE